MTRSLKVIGAIISVVMSSASALSVVGGPTTKIIGGSWGVAPAAASVNVVRRVPETASCDIIMSATTIERPTTTRIAEKKRKQQAAPVKQEKRTGSEAWEVRIYNDVKNTREFVARCLVQVVGLSEMSAYQTMMQAHQNGLAVVGRYAFERAEMYHEALTDNGIMCDIIPVDDDR